MPIFIRSAMPFYNAMIKRHKERGQNYSNISHTKMGTEFGAVSLIGLLGEPHWCARDSYFQYARS